LPLRASLYDTDALGDPRSVSNVIVTSRLGDDHLWAEVLNLGGYDVLAKPLDGSELFRALSSAWRNWCGAEQAHEEKAAVALGC
jgi:FixJ family two-component response regulator